MEQTLVKDKNNNQEDRIERGTVEDINTLAELYDDLNDYLSTNTNYPGWIKGIYPIRETAEEGVKNGTLFVIRRNNEIAGTIILNQDQPDAYNNVRWGVDAKEQEVIVVHTLAVNPRFMKLGIGKKLMEFAVDYSREQKVRTLRLDVFYKNSPAIALYEKSGFTYVDTVDLGLNIPDLVWFRLYEINY
jgi:ribosomal protein S18 acetylase RimI-like enzyme